MLQEIKPNRKRSKAGSLTREEKSLVKGLLLLGYLPQDIVHIVNQGRLSTVNPARIAKVKKDNGIVASSEDEIAYYLKIQSAYDPKTYLNPYKDARLIRAREAMMTAVQVFNNPTIIFKTEVFCVLANIAWTYLLHEKMERTKVGSSKLKNGYTISVNILIKEKNSSICPIKNDLVKKNLEKIIEIRDAVEHTFFVDGEQCFGRLFQACCVNFENHMTEWFGEHLTLAKELSLALQFVRLQKDQVVEIESANFPEKIKAIFKEIQSDEFADDNVFQMTVYYTTEMTSKTNADLHRLLNSTQDNSGKLDVIKDRPLKKITQEEVVKRIGEEGYTNFTKTDHLNFWKSKWATAQDRNCIADKHFGEFFGTWGWYEEKWLPVVLKHCEECGEKYK